MQKISLISFNIRNKMSPTISNLHIHCATRIEIGLVPGKTLNQFKSCHAQFIQVFVNMSAIFRRCQLQFYFDFNLKLIFYHHWQRERKKEKEVGMRNALSGEITSNVCRTLHFALSYTLHKWRILHYFSALSD